LIKRAYSGETVFVKETFFDPSLEPQARGRGRKRWLRSTFFPIKDAQGNVAGIVMMHEDITERKELERVLQDKERLATIGQTAGMVGHDIRNPLQAVMSDTYLLKEELAAIPDCKSNEGIAESIDGIDRNVAYINKIVQDLQDYARPITPEIKEANLTDIFVSVFETVRLPDNIKLNIRVHDTEKIRTDPMLVQRALTNLVNNAIQAMPNGGELKITGSPKDNRLVITIADTGTGIPEEIKPKLFTPMMTTKSKGQGFGLAAVKRMIEVLGGTVSFESQECKGTTFTIELPLTS
jgi:signal transduction histidine kinase